MLLFAGLGNPGRQHAGQRHNIGFMAVDAIARAHTRPLPRPLPGPGQRAAARRRPVVLLKPDTYMNESGRAVAEAMRFYKLAPEDVVVFHDELDIPPGTLRVKTGGGNAGHNGLRSITALVGNDYRRVRLGIGHPGAKELVLGYVLGPFDKGRAGLAGGAVRRRGRQRARPRHAATTWRSPPRSQLRLAAAGFA